MDVWLCAFILCLLSCVYLEVLRRADPPSKESYRLWRGSRNWKCGQGPTKGCTAMIISGGWGPDLFISTRRLGTKWVSKYELHQLTNRDKTRVGVPKALNLRNEVTII
jgi:hypothetical protein